MDAEVMSENDFEMLFSDAEEQETKETPEEKETPNEKTNTPAEEDVDPNTLFEDENPESVGREENNKEKEGADGHQSTSPIYSSLAKTLKEDGILEDLEDADLEKITDVETLKGAVKKWAEAQLDETQKRVNEALENGMEKDEVWKFENQLKVLNGITPEALKEEGDRGENLRKNIIYRDYLNKGFSEERARREVERAVTNGTDVEDAEESLKSIKEFTQSQYDAALDAAKKQSEAYAQENKRQAEELKTSILKDGELIEGLSVDKGTRQRILDSIVKPIYKDPETGDTYTAIQKFEKEHRLEFLKLVGTFLTLTDYGKNLDGLVKGKVKKEVGKATRELENAINSTQRNGDGSLRFATGVTSESYSSDFTLDV